MRKASIATVALILPLLLASCATLNNWPDAFMGQSDDDVPAAYLIEENNPATLNMDVGHSDDPDVAALVARMGQLEQDMAEVRIELSRVLPAIEQLNATVQRNDVTRAVNLRHNAVNADGSSAIPATTDANRFAVHLASYRNRQGAIDGWSELRGRFGPVLNGLQPRVAEVDIEGRGTFYRLKAGPFANWASANETCDYLRAESWSCAVMDFSGDAAE